MTPQIDHLRKTSPCCEGFNTHYGVSKEIDGKTCIFGVNLGMSSLKSIVLENDPKTCTLNLQLLHNTKRTTKWSGYMKMIDPPRELLHRHNTMLPSILLVFSIIIVTLKHISSSCGIATMYPHIETSHHITTLFITTATSKLYLHLPITSYSAIL